MKPVPPPNWDACEDYDAIVEDKHTGRRARLRSLRSTVRRAFKRYRERAAADQLWRQAPARSIGASDSNDLLHCYNTPTQSMKDLRRRLEQLVAGRACPYCGFGEITELDHYFPKVTFPELAVCAYNLIPCCHRCNNIRGEYDWTARQGASVIHVFYEDIDTNNHFLKAAWSFKGDQPDFGFSVKIDPRQPFSARLAQHVETLKLVDRFAVQAVGEVTDLVMDLNGALENCEEGTEAAFVMRFIQQRAQARKARHGANHWEVAFYRAASSQGAAKFLIRRARAS